MASSEIPTIKTKGLPTIFVVGFSTAFVRRCEEAVAITEATVIGIEVGEDGAFPMHELPLAVVMQRDAIRGSKLALIAREIGIGLIAVPGEDITDMRLKELLQGALAAARWSRKLR